MEFTITHFSQLYQMETGKPLTSSSVIYIGGQAGSANDIGIGEAFFPEQSVNVGAATTPVSTCPPHRRRSTSTRTSTASSTRSTATCSG